MISETHTRYGVRSVCHGRSCRPARACHSRSGAAMGDSGSTRRILPLRVRRQRAGLTSVVAELDLAAQGLEAHVRAAPAARAVELVARAVFAGALGPDVEAVGDVTAQ